MTTPRLAFALLAALSAACAATASQPPPGVGPLPQTRPAPLAPMPLMVAMPGAGEAGAALSARLIEGWRDGYGLTPSAMDPAVFAPCVEGDAAAAPACLRAALREERQRVGEVGVIVLVSSGQDGHVRWRCLGASRQDAYLRPQAQDVAFSLDADPTVFDIRQVADACIGGAFAEYMVP
jgi:hypothetical protein